MDVTTRSAPRTTRGDSLPAQFDLSAFGNLLVESGSRSLQ